MRPCLVAFHAHPDDEAIFTGGTIIRAVRSGWRVVLVVATSGESGQTPLWVTTDLAAHRRAETEVSARLLGVDRVVFLGYRDSGIGLPPPGIGHPSARDDGGDAGAEPTLAATSVFEAAQRLHRILLEERATVLTSYDSQGIYEHPDHVRVHEIAAAAVADTECDLVEATVSRPVLRAMRHDLVLRGLEPGIWPTDLLDRVGIDDGGDLLAVDVTDELPLKEVREIG